MNDAFLQLLYQHETLYDVRPSAKTTAVPVAASPIAPPAVPPAVSTQESLAPVGPAPVAPPPRTVPVIKQEVLILVNETPENFALSQPFLAKIVESLGLDFNAIDLLNVHGSGLLDFRAALNHRKAHHFISFGVPFLEVNLDIMMNLYDPKRVKGVNFLFAESLSVIQADNTRKRALWNALKVLFFPTQTQ